MEPLFPRSRVLSDLLVVAYYYKLDNLPTFIRLVAPYISPTTNSFSVFLIPPPSYPPAVPETYYVYVIWLSSSSSVVVLQCPINHEYTFFTNSKLKFINYLFQLVGGVLPKPQTDSEWITSLDGVWNPASLLRTYNLSEVSVRWLMKSCLIRFCIFHYMFYISFFHVSLQQARLTTTDHVNMIKNYHNNNSSDWS